MKDRMREPNTVVITLIARVGSSSSSSSRIGHQVCQHQWESYLRTHRKGLMSMIVIEEGGKLRFNNSLKEHLISFRSASISLDLVLSP